MELVKSNNPILTQVCQEVDFDKPLLEHNGVLLPFSIIEFSQELVKLMRDLGGIGLAANQVGVPYRIFAIRSDPNRVMINPKIVFFSEEKINLEEACLTWPGLYVMIKRSRHIRMRYTQPSGETTTEMFTGISARICQHEMDHLDGIIFFNRANMYHRELALKKWRKSLK